MSRNKQCFVMGLPSAGKTTFLSALWYSLNNATPDSKLRLKEIKSNNYLSELSTNWADCVRLPRTSQSEENMDIYIETSNIKGDVYSIRFPDLSGETFFYQYEYRLITNELAEYIKNADAIMLVINVDNIKELYFITEMPADVKDEQTELEHKNRDIKKDPRQVQIVELVQFIEAIRNKKPVKIGLMISAWDLLIDNDICYTPESYAKEKLSLLWQYFMSNKDMFDVTYWGVSAQGGTYENNEALYDIDPIERIKIIDDENNLCHDITLPLIKLVGESLNE